MGSWLYAWVESWKTLWPREMYWRFKLDGSDRSAFRVFITHLLLKLQVKRVWYCWHLNNFSYAYLWIMSEMMDTDEPIEWSMMKLLSLTDSLPYYDEKLMCLHVFYGKPSCPFTDLVFSLMWRRNLDLIYELRFTSKYHGKPYCCSTHTRCSWIC